MVSAKQKLKDKWSELEDESLQLTYLIDELEELDSEERSPKTTAVYMLLSQKLKSNQEQQMFFENQLEIFKD